MRVLALADKRPPMDPALMAEQMGAQAVVCLRDLHGRRTSLLGRTVAGFEGCVRYGTGGPHHVTQKQASKLARRLLAAEILICHCPPFGINDDPDDPAHVGFEGLREWVDRHRPRHILHGHTHPVAGLASTRHGDTRVHWISGARVVELD